MNRTSNKDDWMPGETLLHRDDSRFHPISMAHGSHQGSEVTSPQSNSASNEIIDALKGLQSGIDSKLSTIMNTLDSVCDRLDTMETRQKCLEEEVRASSLSCNCNPATPLPGRRIRRTPRYLQVCVPSYLPLTVQIYFQLILYCTFLQNKIRLVHSSLDDDKQFQVIAFNCQLYHC